MLGEDLGVGVGEQGRNFCGGGFLLGSRGLSFGDLFGLFDPPSFQSGPVDFLEIEIVEAVNSVGVTGASGLELGRRDGVRCGPRSEQVADGLAARRTNNKIRCDGQMIEVPLGYAFGALITAKGNFEKSCVAFRAFGSDLIAENRAK